MAIHAPGVQIEDVERLERDLAAARRDIARQLREQRAASGLSLRDVAPKVRLSAGALSQTERGQTWETKTVRRILRFYRTVSPSPVGEHAAAA